MEGKQTDHGWNQAAGILMQACPTLVLMDGPLWSCCLLCPLIFSCSFHCDTYRAPNQCSRLRQHTFSVSFFCYSQRVRVQVFNVVILVALVENILRPDQVTVIDPDTGVISVTDSDQSLRDKVRPLGLPLAALPPRL